jgi:hypothetical protein
VFDAVSCFGRRPDRKERSPQPAARTLSGTPGLSGKRIRLRNDDLTLACIDAGGFLA